MKLQKLGGYSAFALVCTFIVLTFIVRFILPTVDSGGLANVMTVTLAAPGKFCLYNLVKMVFCIFFLITIIALHERMHTKVPYLSRIMLIAASAFAAIDISGTTVNMLSIETLALTRDLSAFRACWTVTQGLGNAAHFAAASACLFLGCAILASHTFSRLPGVFLVIQGSLGVIKLPLGFLVPIKPSFTIIVGGILTIVFCTAFILMGIKMLRQESPEPAALEMATTE